MTQFSQEKLNLIQNYYQKAGGLSLIGLNDSMGSSILPWQKSLLQMLNETLSTSNFDPILIDAFSLLLNKTEHLDYFIQNNLSGREIALANYYSSIAAFEKIGIENNLGIFSKLLGMPVRLCKKNFMHNTSDCRLADVIKNSKHVVAILGTGSNDEMRYVGNDPFSIKKDYKLRDKKPNYNYTHERALNAQTLPIILDRIKRNIESVLSTKYHGRGDIQIVC